MIKSIIAAIFLAIVPLCSNAQSPIPMPELGGMMPDYVFHDVTHYKFKTASISEFRGKWLFLDLWSNGCPSCITTFPNINQLQKEFKKEMTWLLVGNNDKSHSVKTHDALKKHYEKIREWHDLDLISAYDSIVFHDWDIPFVSYLYIIDPAGRLRYITGPESISAQRLTDLFAGKPVDFFDYSAGRLNVIAEDVITNKQTIYRSAVTPWNKEWVMPQPVDDFVDVKAKWNRDFLITRSTLRSLYNTAYLGNSNFLSPGMAGYGENFSHPVLKLKDSSLFESNWSLGVGLYNYDLVIPEGGVTRDRVMELMQEDLHRAFGYSAGVEVRPMPVWKLVAGPNAKKKITSRGGEPYHSKVERVYGTGFWVRNIPFREFFPYLISYIGSSERAPTINETEFDFNVDITIDADLTSVEAIRGELKKYDLDLVKSTKPMKVVVIRD